MPNCIDQFHNDQDIDDYLAESDDNIIICLEFDTGSRRNRQQYYCESRGNLLLKMRGFDDNIHLRYPYDVYISSAMGWDTPDEYYPHADDMRNNFEVNRNMITAYLNNHPREIRDIRTLSNIVLFDQPAAESRLYWTRNRVDDFINFLEGDSRFCKLTIQVEINRIGLIVLRRNYDIIIDFKITGVDSNFEIEDEDEDPEIEDEDDSEIEDEDDSEIEDEDPEPEDGDPEAENGDSGSENGDPEAENGDLGSEDGDLGSEDGDSGSEDSGVVEWDNDFFPG